MGKFVNVTVAVALSNVNLRSGPGRIRYRIPRALHDVGTSRPGYTSGHAGRRFLATEDGEDSAAGSSQRTYLAKSSAEASAE